MTTRSEAIARLDANSLAAYSGGMNSERFKTAFDRIGLTQAKVAALLRLGGGQPFVSSILSGRAQPSDRLVAHIELLAEYLEGGRDGA